MTPHRAHTDSKGAAQGNYYIAFVSLTFQNYFLQQLTSFFPAIVHSHKIVTRLCEMDQIHQHPLGIYLSRVAGHVLLAVDGE